jgi:hypothetical protein
MNDQLKAILVKQKQELEQARNRTISDAKAQVYNEVIMTEHRHLDVARDTACAEITKSAAEEAERIKAEAAGKVEQRRKETEEAKKAITEAQYAKVEQELGAAFDEQIAALNKAMGIEG